MVEKGLSDLTAIKARKDIANAYTITQIEEKLPKKTVSKWLDHETERERRLKANESTNEESESEGAEESEDDSENKFERLLSFLKDERKQAERLVQLRPPPKERREGDRNNRERDNSRMSAGLQGREVRHDNSCLVHPNSNHLTRKCHAFNNMNAQERGKVVKDTGGCKLCLSVSHIGSNCPFEGKWKNCDVGGCNKPHNKLVHGATEIACGTIQYQPKESSTLLLIHDVRTSSGKIRTFWDDGSTLSLIAKSYVERMNMVGVKVKYELTTVGNQTTTHYATLHTLKIIDRRGNEHELKAFQIDSICGFIQSIPVKKYIKLFPGLKRKQVERKSGEIELLVGNEVAPLHPQRIGTNEGLVLYETPFGTGRILGGRHTDAKMNEETDYCHSSSASTAGTQGIPIDGAYTHR